MVSHPELSICIPAYDMGGAGATYLSASFERLAIQTGVTFEVVVSDQSETNDVADVCTAFSDRMNIRRIDFVQGKRTASANTNNAMRHASGDIIKVLFQDDFLTEATACAQVLQCFEDCQTMWMLAGSAVSWDGVTLKRPMVPRFHPHIAFGRNTVSSPSVLALRRGKGLWFDEQLIWLMDVDLYRRCYDQFGDPAICEEVLVANRLHDGQVSAGVTRRLRRQELCYVWHKFSETRTLGTCWAFARQYLKTLKPGWRR